ncbi:hypothetical protein Q3G72_031178 [Acer saccharum]|nr:hypothetical protein Q3G72_031178 [Acer saccharum]
MILSVLSSLALVSGLMVARAKNPVHSVLFPIPVFRDTSGLLLLLGLDFSAMIFPVVHIGAIAVSFLFVVMMFHIQIAEIHEEVLRYLPGGGVPLPDLVNEGAEEFIGKVSSFDPLNITKEGTRKATLARLLVAYCILALVSEEAFRLAAEIEGMIQMDKGKVRADLDENGGFRNESQRTTPGSLFRTLNRDHGAGTERDDSELLANGLTYTRGSRLYVPKSASESAYPDIISNKWESVPNMKAAKSLTHRIAAPHLALVGSLVLFRPGYFKSAQRLLISCHSSVIDSLQRLLSEEKNSRKWFRWGIFLFIGSNERWKSRCFWRGISTRCSPLVEYGSSFPFFREPTEDQTKSRAVKPPFSTYCHFLPTTGEQNRSYPAASLAIPPFISPRLSSVAVFSPSLDTFLL